MSVRAITFLFLLAWFDNASAQADYLASFRNEFVDCVSLSTDGSRYEMYLTINYKVKPDAGIVLSVGTYKSGNGMLIFSDDASGYEMLFKKDGRDLIPEVSYPFLLGHRFNYAGNNYPYARYKTKQGSVKGEILAETLIKDGVFSSVKSSDSMAYWEGIWVELKHGRYKTFVGHELLSQGKFKLSKGRLLLIDNLLNKKFAFIISDANILSAEDFIGPSGDYYRVIKKLSKRKRH